MILNRTDGPYSRNTKLTTWAVFIIRIEYSSGRRGKDNAHRWNVTPAGYNQIGRRKRWGRYTNKQLIEFGGAK